MTRITRIPCGIVNCYLVEQSGSFLLVDSAFKGDYKRIEQSLANFDISPGDLRMIFLTHGHIDHAGSAHYFRQRYQIPLAMNSLEDDTSRPFSGNGLINRIIWSFTRATIKRRGPLLPDILLQEKQSLQEYGFNARVIALPGHTAGSMGLLLPEGSLICGDQFSSFTVPQLSHIAEDSTALRRSAQKLHHEQIETIYPGHGKPFEIKRIDLPSESYREAVQLSQHSR